MDLRITFMGSASFALPSLLALVKAGYQVVQVVTRADKPKGRGLEVSRTPVAELASELGLPIIQPKTVRTPEVLEQLRAAAPDLIVVAAYGRILPAEVLNLLRFGCLNVHGSILPKYRGAAPVQWAVINGEKETGVSIMKMDEGLDTGPVYAVGRLPIGEDDNAELVYDRLAELGAQTLMAHLPGILDGSILPVAQDDSLATLALPLEKNTGAINWEASVETIRNLVRGCDPWPGAFTTTAAGVRLRVFGPLSKEIGFGSGGHPGEVLAADAGGIVVRAGDGAIRIPMVQPAGSKKMAARDAVSGRRIAIGDVLGKAELV